MPPQSLESASGPHDGSHVLRWQILCDFDGTISSEDTLAEIMNRFATPEWKAIDEAQASGQFGSREARLRQTALLHAGESDVVTLLDGVSIDPGFPAFLAETTKAGLPLTVVSDGFDVAVRHVFARHGIQNLDVLCNTLGFIAKGGCTVEFPYGDKDCAVEAGVCKCAALGRLRNRKSVLIGNGNSDFCTAGAADFVFAKADLAEHCRNEGIAHCRFEQFEQLIPLVALISGDGTKLLELAGQQAN